VVIGGIALSRPIAWFLLPTLYVWFDRDGRASVKRGGPLRELDPQDLHVIYPEPGAP
jgi:hypothetical protein